MANPKKKKKCHTEYQELPDGGGGGPYKNIGTTRTYVQLTAAAILYVEHGMPQAFHQHYYVRLRYDLISLSLVYRYLHQSAGYCTIPQPISWVLCNTSTNQLLIGRYPHQSAGSCTIPPPISCLLYDISINQLLIERYPHQSAACNDTPTNQLRIVRYIHQ